MPMISQNMVLALSLIGIFLAGTFYMANVAGFFTKNGTWKQQYDKILTSRDQWKDKYEGKETELTQATLVSMHWENQYEDMKSSRDVWETDYWDMKSSYNDMTDERDEWVSNYDYMKESRDGWEADYWSMKSKRDSLQSSIDTLTGELQLITKDRDKWKSEYTSMKASRDDWESQYWDMKSLRDGLQSNFDGLQDDYDSLESSNTQVENQYEDLQLTHSQTLVELESLQSANEGYQAYRDWYNVRCGFSSYACRSITPNDPQVSQKSSEILGYSANGDLSWSDMSDLNSWVGDHTDYNYDTGIWNPYSQSERYDYWQSPNRTLSERRGDCEDQANLLLSLFLAEENVGWAYVALVLFGDGTAHAVVFIDVQDDQMYIYDPTWNSYWFFGLLSTGGWSSDGSGPETVKIAEYEQKAGTSVELVYALYNDDVYKSFNTMQEFYDWF